MIHRFRLPADQASERVVLSIRGADVVFGPPLDSDVDLGEDHPTVITSDHPESAYETTDPEQAALVVAALPDFDYHVVIDDVEYDPVADADEVSTLIAEKAAAEAQAELEAQQAAAEGFILPVAEEAPAEPVDLTPPSDNPDDEDTHF